MKNRAINQLGKMAALILMLITVACKKESSSGRSTDGTQDAAKYELRLRYNNGAEQVYTTASAIKNGDQIVLTAGNDDGLKMMINWRGGLGMHTFASDIQNQFGWFPSADERYVHFYTDATEHVDVPSAGGIQITELTSSSVKGEFTVSTAGKVGNTGTPPAGSIKGSFMARLK